MLMGVSASVKDLDLWSKGHKFKFSRSSINKRFISLKIAIDIANLNNGLVVCPDLKIGIFFF